MISKRTAIMLSVLSIVLCALAISVYCGPADGNSTRASLGFGTDLGLSSDADSETKLGLYLQAEDQNTIGPMNCEKWFENVPNCDGSCANLSQCEADPACASCLQNYVATGVFVHCTGADSGYCRRL